MTYASHQGENCRGFTLVEVLIAMVIALILLAGVVGIVISQNKAANMISDKTDRLSDLFLASQIMQTELRDAQAICWDGTNNQLVYQPQDSTVAVANPCTTVDSTHGAFKFVSAGASGCSTSNTPCVCWDRPNQGSGCQELVRDLKDSTGMQVSPTSNTDLKALRTIKLTALSQNLTRVDRDVPLEFDVWPRN